MRRIKRMPPKLVSFSRATVMRFYAIKPRAGDGTEAVIKYACDCDIVVSAGGDGTLNGPYRGSWHLITGLSDIPEAPQTILQPAWDCRPTS